jgi:hypothetical protein
VCVCAANVICAAHCLSSFFDYFFYVHRALVPTSAAHMVVRAKCQRSRTRTRRYYIMSLYIEDF